MTLLQKLVEMDTAYNLILESRICYLYRKDLPLYEPKEICAHNKTKAAQINERWGKIPFLNNSSILPPKLPPKAFGTGGYCAELLVHMGQNLCGGAGQDTTVPHKKVQ